MFEQPAALDGALIEALSLQRLATLNQEDRLEAIRFFTLALDEKRIIGATLHTGSGNDERMIEVFKDSLDITSPVGFACWVYLQFARGRWR